jgi:hypothetical protein
LQLLLDGVKEHYIDQGRNRNTHPLLRRNIAMRVGVFGLQAPPALRSQARTQWLNHRFAKGCLALVSGIVEHAANGGAIPDRFAGSCAFFGCF